MTDVDVVETPEETPPADPPADPPKEEAPPPAGAADTVAAGAEPKDVEPEKPYWPEDWREKMAEQAAGGDEKVRKQELKRLKRFIDPTAVYGSGREAENRLRSGGLVKLPGKDASEEEVAEYRKTIGVPEEPEGYLENLELANGAVLGDADKPLAESVASALHEVNGTPQQMSALLDWYFANQEEAAAALDDHDDKNYHETMAALKEEYGPAYKRNINSIKTLFTTAPAGLFDRLLKARLVPGEGELHGRIVGDDAEISHWLVGLAHEFNPAASVTEDGDQSGVSIEKELAEIAEARRNDRSKYFKDEKMQARERELLEAQNKIQARKSA